MKLGIISNHANSLCNYWFCRFETEEWGDEQTTRQTLEQASQWLNNTGCWYERKPLILLARLEEHCGNVKRAIAMTIKQFVLPHPAVQSIRRKTESILPDCGCGIGREHFIPSFSRLIRRNFRLVPHRGKRISRSMLGHRSEHPMGTS